MCITTTQPYERWKQKESEEEKHEIRVNTKTAGKPSHSNWKWSQTEKGRPWLETTVDTAVAFVSNCSESTKNTDLALTSGHSSRGAETVDGILLSSPDSSETQHKDSHRKPLEVIWRLQIFRTHLHGNCKVSQQNSRSSGQLIPSHGITATQRRSWLQCVGGFYASNKGLEIEA